ncbi:SURF1 family protein [Nocardioides sp. QY071]|uniref:SURF1 family protein n=1 Tax=Nocardioides sp. QY071 TaxID=3044187 RepID=UPI00249CD730|nr:SURF1 family protein [Nocardioides sp. QY071]WGY02189.1 SURF1 family protein [Nocardioides sp. QY071]
MVRWWSMRLWGAHLLGLVCVSVAVGMGAWQYDAWQARRDAERVDLTHAEPVAMTDLIGPDDPFPTAGLGRPVELRGTFLPEGTVLVSGRTGAKGADGDWLVTPITVGDADAPAVPVVRGWVPAGTDLASLPAPPTGEVDLLGWLQPPEGSGQADDDPRDDVLPELRIADLVQRVDQDLYGAYVVAEEPLAADAAAGVDGATLDQLPEASRFTGLRNILYAIEWWVFAAFAAFLWFRYVRDATSERDLEEADAEAGEDAVVRSDP